MGYYKTSIICENGHLVTGDSNGNNIDNKYCRKCGAKTITSCLKCETPIRGRYKIEGFADLTSYNYVPSYCHNCGEPYPWTKSALEASKILINEDENLTNDEKQQFCESIPDLLVEESTPRTKVAIVRFKKFLGKAATYTADGIKDIFIDVASETIKKSLGI
ncbi:DUF2321 domain-containing protein [Clostridium botulinum]|nr:DUF2321 domain-containing protein [Clostridium botulinum]